MRVLWQHGRHVGMRTDTTTLRPGKRIVWPRPQPYMPLLLLQAKLANWIGPRHPSTQLACS